MEMEMEMKNNKYSFVSDDDIKFLISRPWYKSEQNHYNKINIKLNEICPKTHIVAPLISHVDLTKNNFTDCIDFDSDKTNIILFQMEEGYCHDNCEELLKKKLIKKIYTGYALSPDGKWRFHSWGVDQDNNLIETTSVRIMYWGIEI